MEMEMVCYICSPSILQKTQNSNPVVGKMLQGAHPMIDLKAIKKRHEAATKGPWRAIRDTGVRNDGGYVVFSKAKPSHYLGQDERYEREIGEWHGNLEFIAHARQDLPDCIAEIERLQALVKSAYIEAYQNDWDWESSEAHKALEDKQ